MFGKDFFGGKKWEKWKNKRKGGQKGKMMLEYLYKREGDREHEYYQQ